MRYSLGKARRIEALKNSTGFFSLLALDHSLSHGAVNGLEDIKKWFDFSENNIHISGLVTTVGSINGIERYSKGLIIQTFGLPVTENDAGAHKVRVSGTREAIRIAADCISVQINLFSENLQQHIRDLADGCAEARKYDFPILFMANTPSDVDPKKLLDYIKISTELGADIIKIPLIDSNEHITQAKRIISTAPPIVMAGGDTSGRDVIDKLQQAVNMGYSGYCIGRSIFQSPNPEQVVQDMNNLFIRTI